MNQKMMIAASVLFAVLAAAVVVGSASADSDAAVYGSDIRPYAGIDVDYVELDDGATYYIVKGGSVSISFAGIEASGMETDLAGSGLTTDYVDERICGTLEKSATVTIGEKTIRLEIAESDATLPVYGYDTQATVEARFPNAYIQKAYYQSISYEMTYTSRVGTPTDLSEYGLTTKKTISGDTCTITITGTPVKGADSLFVSITEYKVSGKVSTASHEHIFLLTIVDTFTINYDANGGSCSKSSDSVKYGSTVTLPTATRADHSFLGWYTQASGGICRGTANDSYDPIAHYKVDQSITFYAQWEEDTAPVTSINISGGTSVKVGYSTTLTARTYPDDAKDHRVNWYVNSGSGYASITSTTDTTSGGTCTVKGLSKGTATIRAIAQDGSNVYKDYTITVTEDVVSYSFTLKYNANGGSGAPSSFSTTSTSSTYNASVSTVKPSWSGHTFLGWSTSSSDTSADYVGGDSITLRSGTTTLYAIWEEIKTTWTLTFDANGGSGAPAKQSALEAGTSHTWTLPSTKPTLEGCAFAGWARSESSTVGAYQPGGEFVSYVQDAVLYAVWEEVKTGYEFHVIFDDAKGSGGPGSIDMTAETMSKDIRIPETKPTRAGYEFMGWGINAGTSTVQYEPGKTYTFSTGTTTLFAVWKQYTYVLTLYETDESGTYRTVEGVGVGEVSVTIPSDYLPTRTGYTFFGWKSSDGTVYQPGQVVKLTENLDLFGNWIEMSSEEYTVRFNVTFDESKSTTIVMKPATEGRYYFPDYSVTREGYTFLGWADVDNAPRAVYKAGDLVEMDSHVLMVYAVWKINETTWTLTFNANNGSGAPDGMSLPGTSATTKMEFTIPATKLTRDGYTFQGWDDKEDATTVQIAPSGGTYIATKQNTTLYAVWKLGNPETYTVTFDDNGGSGGPGKKTSDGATIEIPDVTPTRSGHAFVGWTEERDVKEGIVVPGKDATITLKDKETTLWAFWQEITAETVFDVIFDLEGGTGDSIVTKSVASSEVPAKFTIPADYKPAKSGTEFLGWSRSADGEDRYQPGDVVELTSLETVLHAVWKSTSPTAPTLKWELSVKGSVLTYDGSMSENVKSWVWDFGDGGRSSEKSGTHTYDASGTYTVKLVVYSDSGMSSVCTKNVVVTGGSDPVKEKGIGFYLAIILVILIVAVIGARLAGVF